MSRFPILALAALLGVGLPALAQEKTPPPAKAPDASAVRPLKAMVEDEPDPAVLKAMRSQIFVIQHRDAGHLESILRPLGSGIRGARMTSTSSRDFNAISVRDFPENLTSIGAAIQRLDVPAPGKPTQNVELHIQVLFASKAPTPESDIPEELRKVLGTLRGTLAYRGFAPVASFVQRAQVGGRDQHEISGTGVVDPKVIDKEGTKLPSEWRVTWWAGQPSLNVPNEGPALFDLKGFGVKVSESGPKGTQVLADFSTSLSLKEGETVVVGTSVVKDRGLIVVVSARRAQ